jgi:hypothetical protein
MRALRERSTFPDARLTAAGLFRRLLLCAAVLAGAHALDAGRLPDRDATLVMPQGMLVVVDRATFFQDGGLIELRLRNSTYEVARGRVRVAVFDDRLRLKGSVSYCTGVVQPGTRQPVLIPLEVKDAGVRDSFVVYVEEVVTKRRRYTLRQTLAQALGQARAAVDLRGWELTTVEEPRSGDIPDCTCECDAAERMAREGCGDQGAAAFTCTPMVAGCSSGLSCKK